MENTEELDIDIDDIGTILKSSRLKQKKTLEEISSELCIRKIYLTALEESDYDTLPPIPYGIGYVRTYARYLGLNPERAVKLYKTASKVEEQEKEAEEECLPEVTKSSSRHIVAGIVAIAAIYGAWSWYSTAVTPGENDIKGENLLTEEAGTLETEQNSVEAEISDSEVSAEEPLVAEEQDALAPQTPLPEEPVPAVEVPAEIDNNVVLQFEGETWVELKNKNKVYFQGVFHKGDRKEVKYTDNLFLSVGRPQNIKVYIKGSEKDILAKRRKMNIPLDSLD